MGLISYLKGADVLDESRTLTAGTVAESWTPITRTAVPTITEQTALKVTDLYACVRVLADGIASLTPRVFRRTPQGRIEACPDQRLVALFKSPSPGTTAADLFSTAMTHLAVDGNCFIGKFRGGDGEIVQIAPIDPQSVVVEQVGQRVIYTVSRREGISEHGPDDIVHVKSLSQDGLRGVSPVRAAARVLG